MEYYNKYDKNNLLDKCGIISRKNNKFYVNEIEVENNRAISGDCVYIREKKVINIISKAISDKGKETFNPLAATSSFDIKTSDC